MGKQENSSDVSQSVLEVLSLCVSSLPGGRADVWLPHFFFIFFFTFFCPGRHCCPHQVLAGVHRFTDLTLTSSLWPLTPGQPSSTPCLTYDPWLAIIVGSHGKKIKHKNVSRSVLMKFSGHENLTKKWLSNRLDQDVSPLISQYLRFLEMDVHP